MYWKILHIVELYVENTKKKKNQTIKYISLFVTTY